MTRPGTTTQRGSQVDGVLIEPRAWETLIGRPGERARAFRGELGLPIDKPIIMTGHQADWWHPGILAKYLAAQHAGRSLGAAPAWLIVDQDTNDPASLRYPAVEQGRLVERWWQLAGSAGERTTGSRKPIVPTGVPTDLHRALDPGSLVRIDRSLRAHAGAGSLAEQMTAVQCELGLVDPAPMIRATALLGTTLGGWVVDQMRADAAACARAYNEAAAIFPQARIRPLVCRPDEGRVELPLWRIVASGARSVVMADELGGFAVGELAPRALLMTALVRLAGCELFVHGTGGGAYDRITERWIDGWLGETLAPTVVVSATMRLPLVDGPVPSTDDLARARALAHRAQHNPAVVGDEPGQRAKEALLVEIAACRRTGRSARGVFDRMHEQLAAYRIARRDELAALDARAAELARMVADAQLLADRTWPFVLQDAASLGALDRQLAEALGPGGAKRS